MPITVVPSGPLSLPFSALATLVASSTTYQGLVGAGNAAAAIDTIHYPFLDLETQGATLPCSIISDYAALHQSMDRNTFEESGELLLQLFLLPNPAYTDPRDVILDFRNNVGAVLVDMLTNARNPVGDGTTYWGAISWHKHDTPQLCLANDTDLKLVDGSNKPISQFLFAGFVIAWN